MTEAYYSDGINKNSLVSVRLPEGRKHGTVTNQPKARATKIRVLLNGATTPKYFHAGLVESVRVPVDPFSPSASYQSIQRLELKHYLFLYMDKTGNFNAEDVAANGLVTAVTSFYLRCKDAAVVSIVCIL